MTTCDASLAAVPKTAGDLSSFVSVCTEAVHGGVFGAYGVQVVIAKAATVHPPDSLTSLALSAEEPACGVGRGGGAVEGGDGEEEEREGDNMAQPGCIWKLQALHL
ncbi:hypothetical protein Bca52824_014287 [Brassica carinata]|uniref:Uncharacterized protein n=1 Tax=Brassica carinata TaxID=52824 RepID=A0A8X7VZU7_BRACI|nr:hypothetical protein Bca52824_014287 [Brassica carinata]